MQKRTNSDTCSVVVHRSGIRLLHISYIEMYQNTLHMCTCSALILRIPPDIIDTLLHLEIPSGAAVPCPRFEQVATLSFIRD